MASAEQLKAMIRSIAENDEARFYAIAMQVAAREARQGHGKLAQELRELVDKAKERRSAPPPSGKPIPLAQPRGELSSILSVSYPRIRLADMVLEEGNEQRLARILQEQRRLAKLRAHGLSPRRKLLLIGPPGTGKTMSAGALAGEMGLPLFIVRLDGLITKYMGETAAKLRLVFDALSQTRGVYLFDEFDSIGTQRGAPNDVGEIMRVLNSFLQFIEQDDSESLILAATNHPEILDYALFRRFDDVIEYSLPSEELAVKLLMNRLAPYPQDNLSLQKLAREAQHLSFADIARACEEAAKEMIIHSRNAIRGEDLTKALNERMTIGRKGRKMPDKSVAKRLHE